MGTYHLIHSTSGTVYKDDNGDDANNFSVCMLMLSLISHILTSCTTKEHVILELQV